VGSLDISTESHVTKSEVGEGSVRQVLRTQRAEKVRDLLDSDDHQQIRSIVAEEGPAFTDYLNFFEFLGYLLESKQIKAEEVRGLFDYYLRNLKRNEAVAAYIADPTKGFEKLQKLLGMVGEVGCK